MMGATVNLKFLQLKNKENSLDQYPKKVGFYKRKTKKETKKKNPNTFTRITYLMYILLIYMIICLTTFCFS